MQRCNLQRQAKLCESRRNNPLNPPYQGDFERESVQIVDSGVQLLTELFSEFREFAQ